MKRLGWFLLVIVLTGKLAAQNNTVQPGITGIVRDSTTTKPVAYATVSVADTTGNPIATTYSRENGSFKIVVAQPGLYIVEISFVGYKTHIERVIVGQAMNDLGILKVIAGEDQLQEVRVTGRRRLVDQKPGMLVYNAENDLNNKGGTAADVLRKAPVLSVDAQGNVSMRGSTNLKILINGKYSGQMVRNAADALNMMPADMIKSVEIITTPSARYDAEGAAGVINIITKKGRSDFSGTLEAGLSNFEQLVNPRFSLTTAKWNINFAGHMHLNRRKSEQVTDRFTFSNDTAVNRLQQDGIKDNTSPHGSSDLTITYTVDETSEISLGINAWMGHWPDDNRIRSTVSSPGGTITDAYSQSINSTDKYLGADINLAWIKRFGVLGRQLTFQMQGSPSRDLTDYDTWQSSPADDLLYREINNNTIKNRGWTVQADYIQPLNRKGNIQLETGAKLIWRKAANSYSVMASDSADVNKLDPQQDRSDDFRYNQNIVAGYGMFRFTLKNNWFIEAGARVEATYIKGNFIYSPKELDNQFTNFIPTTTLSKKLDEQNTINLSYTKRLTRPYIWDLNPNANTSDPKNVVSGNPNLQPELAHQVELSYGLNLDQAFFLNSSLYWKQTNNAIVQFVQTDANGVSYISKQNLAANHQWGLNLSMTATISTKWTLNGNINTGYTNFKSNALSIFHSGWGTGINLNSTYRFKNNFSAQAFGEYNTNQVTLLGRLGQVYHYSIAGKKEIKKARLTVTVAATNFLTKYIGQSDYKERPEFISVMDNRIYNRAVKLTVGWEFGHSQKQQRERKKIYNSDINSQSKG